MEGSFRVPKETPSSPLSDDDVDALETAIMSCLPESWKRLKNGTMLFFGANIEDLLRGLISWNGERFKWEACTELNRSCRVAMEAMADLVITSRVWFSGVMVLWCCVVLMRVTGYEKCG